MGFNIRLKPIGNGKGAFIFDIVFMLIFFLIGILCIFLGVDNINKTAGWLAAVATIVALNPTLVDYTTQSGDFMQNIELGESGSGIEIGKNIDILYNPEDPTKITGNSFFSKYAFIIGGIIFIIFALAFIVYFILKMVKLNKKKQLTKTINELNKTANENDLSLEYAGAMLSYRFHSFGNDDESFVLETENNHNVCEAKFLFEESKNIKVYELFNYVNDTSKTYKIKFERGDVFVNDKSLGSLLLEMNARIKNYGGQDNDSLFLVILNDKVIAKSSLPSLENIKNAVKNNGSSTEIVLGNYEVSACQEYLDEAFLILFLKALLK